MAEGRLSQNFDTSQKLYLVFGGELQDLSKNIFRNVNNFDIVGIFPSYEMALLNWRAKAQETVDNAHMRYYIVNLETFLKEAPLSA